MISCLLCNSTVIEIYLYKSYPQSQTAIRRTAVGLYVIPESTMKIYEKLSIHNFMRYLACRCGDNGRHSSSGGACRGVFRTVLSGRAISRTRGLIPLFLLPHSDWTRAKSSFRRCNHYFTCRLRGCQRRIWTRNKITWSQFPCRGRCIRDAIRI